MKCAVCGYECGEEKVCPYCGQPLPQVEMNTQDVEKAAEEVEMQANPVASDAKELIVSNTSVQSFGAGKTLIVIFASLFAGFLFVICMTAIIMQWNPFYINQWENAISDHDDSSIFDDYFDSHHDGWGDSYGEWY
ncbi:zinc ribbon domain-containing protein [Merdibacter massiliensis]|uniref:hypothetical protein n=1 Tax=Merdibacter massiliensis TaxID=1871030 RepID=UPI00096A6AA9|nr:hypothetical protein [Merdibacter massiliensis]